MLDTIGHNHSGTLYPAAQSALQPLLTIATAEVGWPSAAALEILTDMLSSFGWFSADGSDRGTYDPGLRVAMREQARESRDRLQTLSIASEPLTGPRARVLLEILDEGD